VPESLLTAVPDGVPAAAAVAHHGQVEVEGDEDWSFELGSLTKLFTGTVLARLVLAGDVALDDAIGPWLPADVAAANPALAAVTLGGLARHTSGLPRLPQAVLERAKRAMHDPYPETSEAEFWADLAAIDVDPGAGMVYSNLGYALLAKVLGAVRGSTYEDLTAREVVEPLALSATTFDVPDDDPGAWRQGMYQGAGGLHAPIGDVVLFMEANLAPESSPIGDALLLAQEESLGWHHGQKDTALRWHNGGTGVYGAFIACRRTDGAGVAMLYRVRHDDAVDAACLARLRQLGD